MCANVQRKMSNFVPMNARRILCNDIRSFHIPIMRYVQIMYRVCSEKAYNILILNTRWGRRKQPSRSKSENLKKSIGCNTLIIKGCTQFFFKIHDFGSAPLISIAPFSFVFMVFTRGFMRMVRTVSEGWMSLMVS